MDASTAVVNLRTETEATLGGLRTDRYSWWAHWRELAEYILPRRYKWLITPNQGNRGSNINQKIVNNTATVAMRVCSAGLMSGMTSPGRPWFRMALDDLTTQADDDVKIWLDATRDIINRIFAESNFYTSVATVYEDLTTFGTASLFIDEDFEDVIRCYTAAAGEYYLGNSARLQVNRWYREYVQTVSQLVDQFGLDNCSPDVQSAYKSGGAQKTREVVVIHAVEPNSAINVNGQLTYPHVAKSFPFRDVYFEWGKSGGVLSARGRHEFPVCCPRWDTVGNDAYGRSPGMDALGDVKQLQVMEKRKGQGIEKLVNPPLKAPASMKNEPASVIPGGVTYYSGTDAKGFSSVYDINPALLTPLTNDVMNVETRIKTTFYNDLFLMIAQLDTVRTATEVDARREEKLIQLGPMLERTENELLDPAIERTFSIAYRANILPPIPEALQGKNVKVEYISMLATAQKAAMTAALERLAAFVGNLSGAIPAALDKIDWDEMIDEYADFLGVSPKVLAPMAEVIQMRTARAKQQQAQQALVEGSAVAQGAETLSNTEVGGGINALQAMLGGGGGPGIELPRAA